MHRIVYELRTIPLAELPTVRDLTGVDRPATAQDLLDRGIVHLHDDIYECVTQERRDPDTLTWAVHGELHPGEVIASGSHRERYARIPDEHAPKVLRAQVIRSNDPETPAAVAVAENLAEVAATLAEYVGDVNGAPLVAFDGPGAVLAEAQRLVEIRGNGIERTVVPIALVQAGDVVEQDRLAPHRWHGESPH